MGPRSRLSTGVVRDVFGVCACMVLLACGTTENNPGGTPLAGQQSFPATGAGAGAGAAGSGGTIAQPPPGGGSGGTGVTVPNQAGAGGAVGGGAGITGMSGMGASGAGAGGMDGSSGMGASGAGAGGMDGTSGSGAAGTGAGGTGGTVRTSKPPCVTKGSQGVFVGDSYVNFVNNLEPRVRQRAQTAMALAAGQRYRDVAVAGTSLNYGFGPIPTQWRDIANSSDKDVKFVVMDGGGNDVLINNSQCLTASVAATDGCKMVVAESVATLKEMWASMKQTGVADVVFFYYPHVPYGGKEILDYAYPLMEGACEEQNSANFTCHFVDLRPVFAGKSGMIGLDQIHPTAAGADLISDTLWMTMKDNCVGQAAASGCCMP